MKCNNLFHIMNIKNIKVGGFANLDKFDIPLSKFNALIALNNYGKSNVISAIDFAIDFIGAPTNQKDDMMAFKPFIPLNTHIDKDPFSFEIEFETQVSNSSHLVQYGFSFDWIKDKKAAGKQIRNEYLKIKNALDSKFQLYISRELTEANYLPSTTGRCNKKIKIKTDELVVNKLLNYDDLFFWEILEKINSIKILSVNTLEHPDRLFRTISGNVAKNEYSLAIPKEEDVAFFIYSLKELDQANYRIFSDAMKTLLPCVSNFAPQEIDFKKIRPKQNKNIPLSFPDKIYDIAVQEKNINQPSSIHYLSSGSQKLFYVTAMAIAAEINRVPLILLEELENSIHPGLMQKLLQILDGILEHTKVVVTSHSPYLLQYLETDQISIGMPNKKGLAIFRKIKKTKIKKAVALAASEGLSIGDLIFDQMIDSAMGESDFLTQLCE